MGSDVLPVIVFQQSIYADNKYIEFFILSRLSVKSHAPASETRANNIKNCCNFIVLVFINPVKFIK